MHPAHRAATPDSTRSGLRPYTAACARSSSGSSTLRLFEDFRRHLIGAARTGGDVVQRLRQNRFGTRPLPYPLLHRTIDGGAPPLGEALAPSQGEPAARFEIHAMPVERFDQCGDSLALWGHRLENDRFPRRGGWADRRMGGLTVRPPDRRL